MTEPAVATAAIPVDELIDDFRLACISRAIDDREITLQKQSRVFFQISGAGHEALLPGPGPPPAARLRLVLPLLPRPGAGARPRRHARPRSCCRRSGSAEDPASRRPPDAVATGATGPATSSPSRARPAASASPPSAAPRPPATSSGARTCPGCDAHGDELTYVSLGEGAVREGEFWESLNTACTLHLPVLYVVRRQRLRHLGAGRPTSPRRRSPSWCAGFRGLEVHRLDGTDYFDGARRGRRRSSPTCGPASGPALIHADVTRPYSHSAADTQSKYRTAEELADEAAHDPIVRLEQRRWSRAACSPPTRRRAIRGRGPRDRGRRGRRGARRAAGPTRRRSPTTSYALPDRRPTRPTACRRAASRCRSARPSGARCTR